MSCQVCLRLNAKTICKSCEMILKSVDKVVNQISFEKYKETLYECDTEQTLFIFDSGDGFEDYNDMMLTDCPHLDAILKPCNKRLDCDSSGLCIQTKEQFIKYLNTDVLVMTSRNIIVVPDFVGKIEILNGYQDFDTSDSECDEEIFEDLDCAILFGIDDAVCVPLDDLPALDEDEKEKFGNQLKKLLQQFF